MTSEKTIYITNVLNNSWSEAFTNINITKNTLNFQFDLLELPLVQGQQILVTTGRKAYDLVRIKVDSWFLQITIYWQEHATIRGLKSLFN